MALYIYIYITVVSSTKLLLKREGSSKGIVQVLVRSTDLGSAKPGFHFIPLDKRITFLDGMEQVAIDFYWRSESFGPGVFTICFELSVLTGRAVPGINAVAQLTIENGVNHQSIKTKDSM